MDSTDRRRETGVLRAQPATATDEAPATRQPDLAARSTLLIPATPRRADMSAPSRSVGSIGTDAPQRSLATRTIGTDARPLVVPPRLTLPMTAPVRAVAPPTRRTPRRASWWRWLRPIIAFVVVAAALVAVLSLSVRQPGTAGRATSQATPPPTGRGPWTTAAVSVVIIPPPPPTPVPTSPPKNTQSTTGAPATGGAPTMQGQASPLEPCHDSTQFVPNISQWTVPPGCYGSIYQPNQANYVSRPGFGFCNWWVRVTHPAHADITENIAYPRGGTPVAGAAIFFDGNVEGALSEGHWAQTVAVAPDHYWVLISEMNFAWRGGGFGRIDYRYIHVGPGVHFVYSFT